MTLEFKIKLEGVEKALKMYDRNHVIRAARRAIEDVAKQVMTEVKKNIREGYNIKYGTLGKFLKLSVRPRNNNLEAVITGEGMGISLFEFGAKQEGVVANKRQFRYNKKAIQRGNIRHGSKVTVLVKKSSGRKVVVTDPKAFIAKMKSGHIGVFQREGNKRLKIRQLYGPGVGGLFGTRNIMGNAKGIVIKKFSPRFNYWLEHYLRGLN